MGQPSQGPQEASWPLDPDALIAVQEQLAAANPEPWQIPSRPLKIGGCFVCFQRGEPGPGSPGDEGWAGAALARPGQKSVAVAVSGVTSAPYVAGLLALREGALLEAAVRRLPEAPDVLLVDATGRDHPRRAGLAVQLGAVLGVPTVGVTHRPLLAVGDWPPSTVGATSPLCLGDEVVGYWVRTRADARPLAIHAGWRVDPSTAVEVVMAALDGRRTPVPISEARQAAREARTRAELER